MKEYYSLSIQETINQLDSSLKGLSQPEAEKRLQQFGFNELKKEKKLTVFDIFISQFKNVFLMLLVFAGALSLLLGEKIEAFAIFGIVLLNAILGFIQEYKAEKAIEALKKISAPTARVFRDGKEQKIHAKELVPGDMLLLESGDIIAADARLIEVSSLQTDEASLTGESVPSKKVTETFKTSTPITAQEDMVFMSTIVTYGKGKGIVTSTGMGTELGKIAQSIQTTEQGETPLQQKFTQLAQQIGIVVVVLIIIVLISGILQGALSFGEILLFALALTVSTIPNSLPIIVTVSLSLGAKRLAKKNMLIKKLYAAESLGAVTVICSDKTGTITKNQMTITDIFYNNKLIKVTGSGYNPDGNFYVEGKKIDPKEVELLLRVGYLCNNSKLNGGDGKFEVTGDPTEGSLIVLGKKRKFPEGYFHNNFSLIEELPFDSERKRMSKIFKNNISRKTEAYVKGAPDILLKVCSRIIDKGKIRKLTKKDIKKISGINNSFAENALRVLAITYKELPKSEKAEYTIEEVEKNLVFVGLVGMIDPPREEVKNAIKQCEEAQIKVVIITGDHAITTKAIAEKIGLFKEGDLILTGSDIENMSDGELEKKIENVRIIARALPIQKLRIVNALQKNGHIVAMTGDGVNDAPALKKADIGVAMGITGTDVAKEVSEATLVDDNFTTIVNAIEEGRDIYAKLIKSARYLLSCNTGEITAILLSIMLKLPLPLLPLQILLMNLLTDDFPALGLGSESTEEGIMRMPPRNPKEKPITGKIFVFIMIFGVIMGIGTLLMFLKYQGSGLSKAQTVAFTTLVMFEMFAVLSSRTIYPSLKHLNPLTNIWLFLAVCLSITIQLIVIYWSPMQSIFGTVPLLASDWVNIIAVSSLGFIIMELSKFLVRILDENSNKTHTGQHT